MFLAALIPLPIKSIKAVNKLLALADMSCLDSVTTNMSLLHRGSHELYKIYDVSLLSALKDLPYLDISC